MKKILLASTALVGFAGAASAEVALSGSAEMGIRGGSAVETQFHHDIDVKFSLSGETDGGLSFGATIDLDEVSNGISNNANPSSVFISGDFGTLTMGDTDGAMDWALTEAGNMGNPGSIADDETGHAGYLGSYLDGDGDGQILRYDYSFDAFSFAISLEQNAGATETGFAIGGKYTADLGGGSLGFGIGYQEAPQAGNADEAFGLSVVYSSDMGLTAGIVYTDMEIAGADTDHLGIGLGYTTGALTLHANYGEYDTAGVTTDGFGLAAAYDLGGGASVHLGYGDSGANTDTYSLGLAMSF